MRAAWLLVACVMAFEIAWGPIGGLCMANDDLKFVRLPAREQPVADALAAAWRTQPSFRPLEVVVAHLSDPVSLESPWVVPVQATGLIALAIATVALARTALPSHPLLWPIALLLVLISPATTASLWQMDACSQTWSAALGAWSVWLAWRWLDSCRSGRGRWPLLVALCLTMLAGLTIKENFYGWALGLALASGTVIVSRMRRDLAAGLRAAWVWIPVVALPAAHVACRWRWSALSGLFGGAGSDSRYQAEFGSNVLVNAALSLGGAVGIGPFHLLLDAEAPVLMRMLPVIATCTVIGIILLGAVMAAVSAGAASGVRWTSLAFAATASIASLGATVTMPAVSELYGLGANVGGALLTAAGAAAIWSASGAPPRRMAHAALTVACLLVAAVGGYGVASRALHFRAVWVAVRTLNGAIISLQQRLAPRPAGDAAAAGMVHVPTACLVGGTHSQYVMPPLQVLDHALTEEWLARHDPRRRVVLSIGTSPAKPRPNEIVLDCGSLPQHGHW